MSVDFLGPPPRGLPLGNQPLGLSPLGLSPPLNPAAITRYTNYQLVQDFLHPKVRVCLVRSRLQAELRLLGCGNRKKETARCAGAQGRPCWRDLKGIFGFPPFLPGILLENLRKPRENNWILKTTMVEKNGESTESTPRNLV